MVVETLFPLLLLPPSLTCWQLQMGKIGAWSFEQDRWEREESGALSQTTALGHKGWIGARSLSVHLIVYSKQ